MNNNQKQKKKGMLVIDVQNGLFDRSIPIYDAEKVLENINTLINRARQVDIPVIFIQHSNDKTFIRGSEAWQFHPEIQPLDDEEIIHKLHGDAFKDTNLHEELENQNVSELFITGLVTHGCVRATCLGAIGKGYKAVLVSDGHSNCSKDAHKVIEKWNLALSEKGAELLCTQDVDFK